jgi:acyl carrier protein
MTTEEKIQRLEKIFQDVLDLPGLRLTENFSTADCPEWDSVATVQIVLATEDAFGVRVSVENVATLRSVREILALLP